MEDNEVKYEVKSCEGYNNSVPYSVGRASYSPGCSFYSMQSLGGRQYGR